MHSSNDFKLLVKQTKNATLRNSLFSAVSGQARTQTAQILGVATGSVNTWVKVYLSNGLEVLNSQPRAGRTCSLTESQLAELLSLLKAFG